MSDFSCPPSFASCDWRRAAFDNSPRQSCGGGAVERKAMKPGDNILVRARAWKGQLVTPAIDPVPCVVLNVIGDTIRVKAADPKSVLKPLRISAIDLAFSAAPPTAR